MIKTKIDSNWEKYIQDLANKVRPQICPMRLEIFYEAAANNGCCVKVGPRTFTANHGHVEEFKALRKELADRMAKSVRAKHRLSENSRCAIAADSFVSESSISRLKNGEKISSIDAACEAEIMRRIKQADEDTSIMLENSARTMSKEYGFSEPMIRQCYEEFYPRGVSTVFEGDNSAVGRFMRMALTSNSVAVSGYY